MLDFQLVAKRPCLVGDPARNNADLHVAPGEVVPFCMNWEVLEVLGYVDRVYEVDERREAPPAIPSDLDAFKVDELRDLLESLGVPPHRVLGSGQGGNVLKKDLIAAIRATK